MDHSDLDVKTLGDSGNTLKAQRTRADYNAVSSPSSSTVQKQLDETRDFEILLAHISKTKGTSTSAIGSALSCRGERKPETR